MLHDKSDVAASSFVIPGPELVTK
eukprot:COSAG02_NODE_24979_length_672_cov_0.900524_1_plen_23_part_10